jgi:hypothetical protein
VDYLGVSKFLFDRLPTVFYQVHHFLGRRTSKSRRRKMRLSFKSILATVFLASQTKIEALRFFLGRGYAKSLHSKTQTAQRFPSMITRSMELNWTEDEFDGSWIAQGELRRYRVYPKSDGWHVVCHSWPRSWPRYDSRPVNVQDLAMGVSLDEAKARCQEHSNQ